MGLLLLHVRKESCAFVELSERMVVP